MQVQRLGEQDYQECWQRMIDFTVNRAPGADDELWLLEHPATYTFGQAGKAEHLLSSYDSSIPVVNSDRGGQITYHGPGQLIAYLFVDLKRKNFHIRNLVTAIEASVIDLLMEYAIHAHTRSDAPGVYVDDAKICSLGLRIKRGCSYHGLALNLDMDLTPFNDINPCGFEGLKITQLSDLTPEYHHNTDYNSFKNRLINHLKCNLGYTIEA